MSYLSIIGDRLIRICTHKTEPTKTMSIEKTTLPEAKPPERRIQGAISLQRKKGGHNDTRNPLCTGLGTKQVARRG